MPSNTAICRIRISYVIQHQHRGLIPAAKSPKTEQKQNNIGNLVYFSVCYTTPFKFILNQLTTLAFPMKKQHEPIDGQYFP